MRFTNVFNIFRLNHNEIHVLNNENIVNNKNIKNHNNLYYFFNKKKQKSINKNSINKSESLNENDKYSNDYIKCIMHEIKHPLNNISLGIDNIKILINNKDDINKEEINNLIDNIILSCEYMNITLNNFVSLNKYKNNMLDYDFTNAKPFNFIGMIKNTEKLLHYNLNIKHITIKYYYDDNMNKWVIGDNNQIIHIFINLLSNSIKFSNQNSTIKIKINSNFVNNNQNFIISVIDENKHIIQEIKQNLFNKYNTTNGTGLGLYIANEIAKKYNGNIYHEYIYPIGNKFVINLSLEYCINNTYIYSENKSYENICFNSLKINNKHDNNNNNAINILIVDDSKLTREMLSKLLNNYIIDKNIIINIYEATNGADALVKINDNINYFDIIFIDNIMPLLSGPITTSIIRNLGYKKLIIGITGNSIIDDIDIFYKYGVNYVFIKPFTINNLEYLLNFINNNDYKNIDKKILKIDNNKLLLETNYIKKKYNEEFKEEY